MSEEQGTFFSVSSLSIPLFLKITLTYQRAQEVVRKGGSSWPVGMPLPTEVPNAVKRSHYQVNTAGKCALTIMTSVVRTLSHCSACRI
jgi:hypothetical protein